MSGNSTAARARNAVHKGNSINALRRYNRHRSTPHMANATIRKPRPKYLSLSALLFEIRLPLAGWVSILHRISGLLLFLAVVWLLFMLDRSLASEEGFEAMRRYAGLLPVKLALLALIWAYCHHFCAG